MIIQNTSNVTQASQPAKQASESSPVVANTQTSVPLEKPQASAKPAAEQQPFNEQLKNVVDNINKILKQSNKNLEFSVDESSKKPLFKLKDTETGDVIRQYPTEGMLAISRAIDQVQQGLLLKQEA